MKLIGFDKEAEKEPVEPCLFKRFGSGHHLILDRCNQGHEIMIIASPDIDVLFCEPGGKITYVRSHDGRIEYGDFDEDNEYIEKLDSNQIIITSKAALKQKVI